MRNAEIEGNITVRNFYLTIATESQLFLMRPGNGGMPVYSPVDVNATLHCVVNDSELDPEWEIDGFTFASPFQQRQLHSRQIFQGSTMALGNIKSSSMIIFGDIVENNGTRIYCLASHGQGLVKAYTVLIVYGMILFKE